LRSISQPASSITTGYFAAFVETVSGISRGQAWLVLVIALPLLAYLDYLAGRDISMLMPNLTLTCFVAWVLGERIGVSVALAVTVLGAILKYSALFQGTAPQGVEAAAAAWNTLGRGTASVMVALFAHALRVTLEKERWRASTDGLTGALNKNAFRDRMKGAIEVSQRRDGALVLGYIDLDGFKSVNDGHGHSAGDRVLIAFSEGVGSSIRHEDLFARIGGDEFVVLLNVPDVGAGDIAAEVLHARLTEILRTTGFKVTCSMGAIVLDSRQVDKGETFLELADHLMYEVKRSGKNALRVARGDLVGDALRSAFPPPPTDALDALLAQIDIADRALSQRKFAA
jgi:diguanylate cyclase (GGDEF)-like protein